MTDQRKILGLHRVYPISDARQIGDGIVFAGMRLRIAQQARDNGIELDWETLTEDRIDGGLCRCDQGHPFGECSEPATHYEYHSTVKGVEE